MNKGKFLLISLAGMLAVSCATDNVDQQSGSVSLDASHAKIVNTSVDAQNGKLLIYVDAESVAQLEAAQNALNTGVSDFDAIVAEIGATSVKQVFNMSVDGEAKRAAGLDRWFSVQFPESVDANVVAEKFAAANIVDRVQFATFVHAPEVKATPAAPVYATRADEAYFNDPYLPMQWHYTNTGNKELFPTAVAGADINAIPAWNITKGNRDVIVAIMDEGVDYTHEDLKDNMLANEAELNGQEGVDDDGNGYVDDVYGFNFVLDKDGNFKGKLSWNDKGDSGHGTHVAGTVAAVNNNGIGVAGVAGGSGNNDGVRMISTQIFSGEGGNDIESTAKAAIYAADRGAVILQCSWGLPAGSVPNDNTFRTGAWSIQYDAFMYFVKKKNHPALDGGLIIFASGNEGNASSSYPAAYNEFIAVTATAPDGLPAYYTNYDKGCNIAAPGGEYYTNDFYHFVDTGCVLSTLPKEHSETGYGYMQGTSMACPHVSGIAALALSYAADMGKCYSVKEFQTMLLTAVNNLDSMLNEDVKRINPMSLEEYKMDRYYKKMGTGSIDAFRALMAVRGTRCVPVVAGEENTIKISSLYGDGQTKLSKLEDIIIPDDVRARLGIRNETIFGDEFIFECDNTGAGVVTLLLIAGGETVGSGQSIGGMRIELELGLVAREGNQNLEDSNIGGWL